MFSFFLLLHASASTSSFPFMFWFHFNVFFWTYSAYKVIVDAKGFLSTFHRVSLCSSSYEFQVFFFPFYFMHKRTVMKTGPGKYTTTAITTATITTASIVTRTHIKYTAWWRQKWMWSQRNMQLCIMVLLGWATCDHLVLSANRIWVSKIENNNSVVHLYKRNNKLR